MKILIISDDRLGHINQSLGIAKCLKDKYKIDHEIRRPLKLLDYNNWTFSKTDYLFVLGAGHATHLSLLFLRYIARQKVVCLMKPSFPLSMFDLVIAPEHDGISEKANVVLTKGVPNLAEKKEKITNTGVILIGGPSKSNDWPEASVFEQIMEITKDDSLDWRLFDSPRTPNGTREILHKQFKDKYLPMTELSQGELSEYLATSEKCWVTEDSASMLYEALTAGCQTGVISVNACEENKVIKGVRQLINDGIVAKYPDVSFSNTRNCRVAFNEAERCADILFERFCC